MNKTKYALAAILAGTVFGGCQTPTQKVEAAQNKVQEAKQDLQEAKRELNAEYPAFRKEAEEKIEANDKRIAELRAKLDKPGKAPLDDMRVTRINELQRRNADLKSRLYSYEKERTDWQAFKAQFKHDADNLGDAFRDFANDLKK